MQPEPAIEDNRTPMLVVEELVVTLGGRRVLDRVGFRVERGASVAIIGPNGAGKTVLFQALVGMLPHDGVVRWAAGTRLGYVPQKLDLERDLPITGRDLLVARRRVLGAADDLAAIARQVALDESLDRPIGALSGGQFQRLLVALALIGEPDALLLDEFTTGVDAPGQQRLTELIHQLQAERDLTVLAISHDLSVVLRSASRVLCLAHAHAWFGPPRKILTPELLHEVYGTPAEFHVPHG